MRYFLIFYVESIPLSESNEYYIVMQKVQGSVFPIKTLIIFGD